MGHNYVCIWLGVTFFLITQKIYDMATEQKAVLIANRAEFYIALSTMIIGVQFFLAGFIGELISRNSESRNNYLIKEKTIYKVLNLITN
jgi:hypothetical protein